MTATSDLQSALERIEDLALRSNAPAIAAEAAAVVGRMRDEQFVVACIGQFKRGKSTLIGALIDEPALAVGVTPTTAVPTIVRYGRERIARILVGTEWREIPIEELAARVSEDPAGVAEQRPAVAEVSLPSPILADGVVLVDTPGLGSVFSAGADATRAFLPHVDVAVAVIGTDPPISGDELQLITDLAAQTEHVFVVLNKSDKATAAERAAARAFAQRMIEQRIGRALTRMYELSATDQLVGRFAWPDWSMLVSDLRELAATRRYDLAARAGIRAVARLTSLLDAALALEQSALTEPVDRAARRVRSLTAIVDETSRSLTDLSTLLNAREVELARAFGQRARRFVDAVRGDAHEALRKRISELAVRHGPRYRLASLATAQDVAREIVGRWRPDAESGAREAYESAMRQATDAIRAVGRRAMRDEDTAATLTAFTSGALTLAEESHFRFNEQVTIAQPASPIRYLADLLLAAVGARRVIAAAAHRFLDWLLDLNVGRAESDLIERARSSRQRLQAELARSLAAVKSSAEASLDLGMRARDAGTASVVRELDRIGAARGELEAIRRRLLLD